VVFPQPFNAWPVISILVNPSAYSQVLHTILRHLTELQMEILEAHGGEAAELLKVDNKVKEATGTSSVTWKIGL